MAFDSHRQTSITTIPSSKLLLATVLLIYIGIDALSLASALRPPPTFVPFLLPNSHCQGVSSQTTEHHSLLKSSKRKVNSFSKFHSTTRTSVVKLCNQMRSWMCTGKSHKEVIENLVKANIVHSPLVKEALLLVDRANYAPSPTTPQSSPTQPYRDAPQPIGHGQTISAPHMHAHALEQLYPTLLRFSSSPSTTQPINILDVGCGSGYLTAALARLALLLHDQTQHHHQNQSPITTIFPHSNRPPPRVHTIDVIPPLVERTLTNLRRSDTDLLESGAIATVRVGDGWMGLPEKAPFHAVHVGAAAETFPQTLMMQLVAPEAVSGKAEGGRGGVMVVPVGEVGGIQTLYRIERLREREEYHQEDFLIESLFGVRYVPLVRPSSPPHP